MILDSIFRWIWRINGLLILLGASVLGVYLLLNAISSFKRSAIEMPVSNIAADPDGAEKWVSAAPVLSVEQSICIYR